MKRQAFVLTLGVVLVGVMISMRMLVGGVAGQGRGEQIQVGDYRLSGPYTHRNLTIFLVHGKDLIKGKSFLTLQEALVQKMYTCKPAISLKAANRIA